MENDKTLTREEKLRILRAPLPYEYNVVAPKSWGGRSHCYDSLYVRSIRHRMSGHDESHWIRGEE